MAGLNKNVDTNAGAGAVLLVLLAIGGFIYWNAQSQTSTPITQTQQSSDLLPATPTSADLKIGKTSESTDDSGYKYIYAEVTNSGAPKTGVSLTATLYDSSGTVIGTTYGAVQNLGTGETKVAEFIITDSKQKTYAKYKVDLNGSY